MRPICRGSLQKRLSLYLQFALQLLLQFRCCRTNLLASRVPVFLLHAVSIFPMPFSPRSLRCTVLAFVLCATSLLPVCAQISTPPPTSASPGPTPSSQRRAITIGQISVSPDGKRLAWVDGGVILFTSFGNLGQTQRITAATSPDSSCTESDPVWSPDSAALAFLSDCADLGGQSDLYLSHLDG